MNDLRKAKEIAGRLLATDQSQQQLIGALMEMARYKDECFDDRIRKVEKKRQKLEGK